MKLEFTEDSDHSFDLQQDPKMNKKMTKSLTLSKNAQYENSNSSSSEFDENEDMNNNNGQTIVDMRSNSASYGG